MSGVGSHHHSHHHGHHAEHDGKQSNEHKSDEHKPDQPKSQEHEHRAGARHVHGHELPHTWRGHVLHILHLPIVHYALLVLLLVDVAIVIGELMMDAHPVCVVRHVSCTGTPPPHGHAHHQHAHHPDHDRGLLNHDPDKGHGIITKVDEDVCTKGGYPNCTAVPELPHHLHNLHVKLKWASVSILIVFEIEAILLIICLGWSWLGEYMYVLDFVVVTSSLVLDLKFSNLEGNVLILLRLWRFARVLHGFTMTVQGVTTPLHMKEKQILQDLIDDLKDSLDDMKNKLTRSEEEVRQLKVALPQGSELRKRLTSHGVAD